MENYKQTIATLEDKKDIQGLEELKNTSEGEIAELAQDAINRLNEKVTEAETNPSYAEEKLGTEKVKELTKDVDAEIEGLKKDTETEIKGVMDGEKTEVSNTENFETSDIEKKKESLLKKWEQNYESGIRNDEKARKLEDVAKLIQEGNIDLKFQSMDTLTRTLGMSKKELYSTLPKLSNKIGGEAVKNGTSILVTELFKANQNELYTNLDDIMQNTPADVLKKMMETDTVFAQRVGQMQKVYGAEIGKLIQKTQDPRMIYTPDVIQALNYMGSAGKLMNKEAIEKPVQDMVSKLLESNAPSSSFQALNYANLCEAGFTDEAIQLLHKAIEKRSIGGFQIMKLKEAGLLNEEQTKDLALLENTVAISDVQEKLQKTQEELGMMQKALEQAETAVAQNPDNIVTIEAYGLGKGKASDLIIKYRELMQNDIKGKQGFVEFYQNDLKRLES
jgi:tetratricopeptide (TPR) repeat protein